MLELFDNYIIVKIMKINSAHEWFIVHNKEPENYRMFRVNGQPGL